MHCSTDIPSLPALFGGAFLFERQNVQLLGLQQQLLQLQQLVSTQHTAAREHTEATPREHTADGWLMSREQQLVSTPLWNATG